MCAVIGLDIGGTNLRIGLVREGVLERGKVFSTHEELADGDEILRIAALIEEFRGQDEVDAVSIGFPSSIKSDGKTVLNVPNIIKADGSHAFSGKNVVDPLERLLGKKVFAGKDTNNLLYCDAKTSNAGGILVGCYIGTGFGAAAMIDGRLILGKHGAALEAGHIPFYRGTRRCNCGKTGCAECYASGRAAQEMLKEHFPGRTFAQVFKDHADEAPVAELIEALAVTVATLVNLFDPDILFLGGGVLSAEFPKERLSAAVRRNTLAPYPREDLTISYSANDEFAGVTGAALYAEASLRKPLR